MFFSSHLEIRWRKYIAENGRIIKETDEEGAILEIC